MSHLAIRLLSLSVAVCIVVVLPAKALADGCDVRILYYNADRYVPGPVNTECSCCHSQPWGNWGVSSPHGSQYDGFQFSGWMPMGGWLQWNSCTGEHPPPSASYYNHESYTTQADHTTNVREYAQWWLEPMPYSCSVIMSNGVYTVGTTYMTIWELDFPDSDDSNGTLNYPGANIAMSCGGGYCSGESSWLSPSSGSSNLDANIKVVVEMWDY